MEKKKFCKRGHERTPENVALDNGCKICRKAREAIYRRLPKVKERIKCLKAKNIQKTREYQRKWMSQWRKNNPEKARERQRNTRIKYAERYRIKGRMWQEKNKERLIEKRKNEVANLTDKYIAGDLRLTGKEVTPENIKICRDGIISKRKIRKLYIDNPTLRKEKKREYYQEPEVLEHRVRWAKTYRQKPEVKHCNRARCRKARKELAPSIVAGYLGIYIKDAPPELIEMKRQGLILHRNVKQLKKWRGEHESDSTVIHGQQCESVTANEVAGGSEQA